MKTNLSNKKLLVKALKNLRKVTFRDEFGKLYKYYNMEVRKDKENNEIEFYCESNIDEYTFTCNLVDEIGKLLVKRDGNEDEFQKFAIYISCNTKKLNTEDRIFYCWFEKLEKLA